DHRERLLGAVRLPDDVPLELEVDPDELPHARVVVDDEDDRAELLAPRAGARDERLEVRAAVAAMPARRVEGRHAPEIRPLADRRVGAAGGLRRLAEGH